MLAAIFCARVLPMLTPPVGAVAVGVACLIMLPNPHEVEVVVGADEPGATYGNPKGGVVGAFGLAGIPVC